MNLMGQKGEGRMFNWRSKKGCPGSIEYHLCVHPPKVNPLLFLWGMNGWFRDPLVSALVPFFQYPSYPVHLPLKKVVV